MKEFWKKGCSFLVSATLAVGLIPVPAFAQAAEAITSSGGITAASPQENLKEVEQPATQAAPTSLEGITLGAQAVDAEMVLGESYAVSLAEGGYWVGSFTAPETGGYQFASSTDGYGYCDTYGELYEDANLSEILAENDDGGIDRCFLIRQGLEKGETVYLKARQYSDGAGEFAVSVSAVDTHDLMNANISIENTSFALTGEAIVPDVTVTDAVGSELRSGTDYQLVYYDDDGIELDAAPSAPGDYSVRARAAEGSAYTGETGQHWFNIYDPNDIGSPMWSLTYEGDNQIDYTGSPVVVPTISIYRYDSDSETDIYLEEGRDYKLSYYQKVSNSQKFVDTAPVNPGAYYAIYEGMGQYSGVLKFYFSIVGDNYDLSFANITLYENLYSYTGDPVSLNDYDVLDASGEFVSANAYELVYYQQAQGGTALASAPSEPGDYYVAVRAVAGSEYSGESSERAAFTILGANDLRNDDFSIGFNDNRVAANKAGITLPAVSVRRYADDSYKYLVEGTDFAFDYFMSYDGEKLASAPTEVGDYYAVYKGIGSYTGSRKAYLQVCDPFDLAYANVAFVDEDGDSVPLENGAAVPEVVVTDLAGNKLAQGTDYVQKYVPANGYGSPDWSAVTDTPPSSAGSYYVAVYPGSNSKYTNHSDETWFNVYNPYDIGNGRWNARFWPNSSIAATGSPVKLPTPLIYRWVDDDVDDGVYAYLTEGTDYVFDHFETDEGENIGITAPANAGDYHAVYKGNGSYLGTRSIYFSINDAFNIGSDYWESEFRHSNTYYTDGEAVELRQLLVYNYSDAAFLAEGTHFKFAYFEDDEGKKLTAAPSEDGYYYAVYEGIAPYTGTIREWFNITNSMSLNNAQLTLATYTYPPTGSPVKLEAKVHDYDGILLKEGTDYQLVYYKYDSDQYLYTVCDSVPSEKGDYYVAARAANGGLYSGESSKCSFVIGDPSPVTPVVDPEKGTLVVDTPFSVEVKDNQYWIGTFTAPSTGAYVFSSEGDADTYGQLYADADLTDLLESNDDWNGYNFQITQALEANQTVYLKVSELSNSAMSCTVQTSKLDEKNLTFAMLDMEKTTIALKGATVAPTVTVSDALGNEVPSGAYTLEYYKNGDNGYEKISSEPSEVGSYQVCAVAKSGSGYTGSTGKESFRVRSAYDLATASLTLASSNISYTGSPVNVAATVTDAAGAVLTEGTDYELVYYGYQYGNYVKLPAAPTEPGDDYYVVARAKSGGNYTGKTGSRYFEIVNPKDISTNGSVSLITYLYNRSIGYTSVPVYLYEGTAVTPAMNVFCYSDGKTLDASNYTVSCSNNTAPTQAGELASVTITAKSPYSGSVTKNFMVDAKINLEEYLWYHGCQVAEGKSIVYHWSSGSSSKPQYLATGWPVMPVVTFTSGSGTRIPQLGTDYTIAYEDANGKLVTEPTAPGKYHAVLTATASGMCTGKVEVPFAIAELFELDYNYVRPSIANQSGISVEDVLYSGNTTTYETNELKGTFSLTDFLWDIVSGGKTLTEGVDYLLKATANAAGDLFTYVFTGIGNYTGTITSEVQFVGSAKDSFNARDVYFNDTVRNVVYRDSSGALEAPVVRMEGLTSDVDFKYAGLFDASGKAVTSAKANDTVFVRLEGAGAYAGITRTLEATVIDGTSVISLDSGNVVFSLANGVGVNDNGTKWYLLNSATPSVALMVYGRTTFSMTEGNGFNVAQTVNGSNLNLTLTATADSPVSGSTTKSVTLVPSYNLNNLVASLRVSDPTSSPRSYIVANNNTVTLEYADLPYVPTVVFPTVVAGDPQVRTTLKNSAGTAVDKITGAGSYTLAIEGTGDWNGSLSVPLTVNAAIGDINLANCVMVIGDNTGLVNGQAKPTVTLTCGDYTLVEGTDYTLEYGNNTAVGQRAYVKVTAVKGGKFRGLQSANFTVSSAEDKDISKGNFEIWLQNPAGDDFEAASDVLRTYPLGTTPAVKVMYKDASGALAELAAANYTLTYGDLSKSGVVIVTVTGKNGYSGSLSAQFVLASSTAKKDQTITASDQTVQVGGKVKLGATTTGDSELSYVSSKPEIAAVNAKTGEITGNKAGTATITITAPETATYNSATKTITVTVTAKSTPTPQPEKKVAQTITASNKTVSVSKKVAIGATASGKGKLTYQSSNTAIATVNADGVVTGKKAGKATITIDAAAVGNYLPATATITVTVVKVKNTLATKAAKKTLKYSSLKKKASTFAPKIIKKKGKGKLTYTKKSVTKKYKKYVSVNKTTGKITVKKKAPKGKCVFTVKVRAAGNATYKALTKTAKVTITIK